MKRTSVRLLLAVLVAVFALGSYAEAAPRKVHHRARHSSRVSAGATQSTKRVTRKHHRASAVKHSIRTHRPSTKPR